MTKTPRGRCSQELRQQAVTMAVKDGFGVTATARSLSIHLKTLMNLATQYRQDKQGVVLKPGVNEQKAELARLKKKTPAAYGARHSKKTAAYFAKEPL